MRKAYGTCKAARCNATIPYLIATLMVNRNSIMNLETQERLEDLIYGLMITSKWPEKGIIYDIQIHNLVSAYMSIVCALKIMDEGLEGIT